MMNPDAARRKFLTEPVISLHDHRPYEPLLDVRRVNVRNGVTPAPEATEP